MKSFVESCERLVEILVRKKVVSLGEFYEILESPLRESGANEAIHNVKSKIVESKEIETSGLPRSLATSRNDKNIDSSDLQNRNKNNLHEVQQPQEASSGVRERVVREGEGSDFAFVRSTNPHLQIQAPFPSLKVESIENPCEKDSSKNGNLESNKNLSLSLRENGANEAIQSVDCHDSANAESRNDNNTKNQINNNLNKIYNFLFPYNLIKWRSPKKRDKFHSLELQGIVGKWHSPLMKGDFKGGTLPPLHKIIATKLRIIGRATHQNEINGSNEVAAQIKNSESEAARNEKDSVRLPRSLATSRNDKEIILAESRNDKNIESKTTKSSTTNPQIAESKNVESCDDIETHLELCKSLGIPLIVENSNIFSLTHEPLSSQTLCFVDIETSGCSTECQIIEIGAVKYKNGEILGKFESFVRTDYISRKITELTGIETHDTRNAPSLKEVLESFKIFLGTSVFVAHNVAFDYNFINAKLQDSALPPMLNRKICTLLLSRRCLESPKYGLEYLNEFLGINYPIRHRAYADALVSLRVFEHCIINLPSWIESTEDIIAFCAPKKAR